MKKKYLLWLILLTPMFLLAQVPLSSSPTLTFTSNPAAITSDDIASDGEGGSLTISDIDIQIYNISNTAGTLLPALSWQDNNSFLGSLSPFYSGLTNENNAGSKGMAIKSQDGSEFSLLQFVYLNSAIYSYGNYFVICPSKSKKRKIDSV